MIWAKEKTLNYEVGGEILSVTFKILNALEWNADIVEADPKPSAFDMLKKYTTKVEGCGITSMQELLEASGSREIVDDIVVQFIKANSIEVKLKNA